MAVTLLLAESAQLQACLASLQHLRSSEMHTYSQFCRKGPVYSTTVDCKGRDYNELQIVAKSGHVALSLLARLTCVLMRAGFKARPEHRRRTTDGTASASDVLLSSFHLGNR